MRGYYKSVFIKKKKTCLRKQTHLLLYWYQYKIDSEHEALYDSIQDSNVFQEFFKSVSQFLLDSQWLCLWVLTTPFVMIRWWHPCKGGAGWLMFKHDHETYSRHTNEMEIWFLMLAEHCPIVSQVTQVILCCFKGHLSWSFYFLYVLGIVNSHIINYIIVSTSSELSNITYI